MGDRALQVKSRGASILALCREIETVPTERTFQIVECGLHSGFPRCCITFFVKAYEPLAWVQWQMRPYGETIEQLLARALPLQAEAIQAVVCYRAKQDQLGPRIGYVACFDCLHAKRFVKVRRCDWHLTVRERRRILADAIVNVTRTTGSG